MEQREIVSVADYNSRGTYGRTISTIKIDIDTAAKKKLDDAVDMLKIQYDITNEDISVYTHPNFNSCNILILVTAFSLRKNIVQENATLEDLNETAVDESVNLIYERLASKYSIKAHVKDVTIARMKFTLISYIDLIYKTLENINKYKDEMTKSYFFFSDPENFDKFIQSQKEIELKLESSPKNANITEEEISEPEEKISEEEEVFTSEIKKIKNKNIKILRLKYKNKLITIKQFLDFLQDPSFRIMLSDALSKIYNYLNVEIIPFSLEDYEEKVFELAAIQTDEIEPNVNEFKSKFNTKSSNTCISFRKAKQIYIVPKFLNKGENATNPEVYANISPFCSSASNLQKTDFFKLLSSEIKNNIQSVSKMYVSSGKTNWVNMIISDNDKNYTYSKYLNA